MSTTLTVQAGIPYELHVTLTDGKTLWPTRDGFEVRGQVRRYRSETSALLCDLTPHLNVAYDGNDITVRLALTGAQTRALSGGAYDIVISDAGPEDERAIVLVSGAVVVEPIVTSAS